MFQENMPIKAANKEVKANLDDHIESYVLLARLIRAKYEALLQNGFTEDQALELCRDL